MDAVASMLYLDYGKNPGEWVPNIYGGHENLEAVEFLKHLNSVFKGRADGAVLIAEESTAWPEITGDIKEGALGFDYKWNMGWMNDFTGYMQCDPYFRKHHYGELTFSMLYAYSEDFILVFSHDEVVHGKGSMIGKMPGEELETKAANLRAAYGFMMSHPGKKLLFMGQEFAQVHEWNENAELDWEITEQPVHKQMQEYVKSLNEIYVNYPALHQMDYEPEGFEWVNCTDSEESIVVFLRRTKKKEETLLIVCNFDTVLHEKFRVGVPFAGKYKEISNSDAESYGGEGRTNPRAKSSKKAEKDERPDSIEITVAPLSVMIFTCTPVEEKVVKKASGAKTTAAKTTAAKTAGVKAAGTKAAVKKAPAKKTAVTKAVEVKAEAETIEDKKPEAQKMVEVKAEAEKIEDRKPDTKKITDKKPAAEKIEDKKPDTKKITDKKPAAEKIEDKKPATKKIADKKVVAEKIEDKKPETKKIADKKVVAEKIEDKKPETKKIADKKTVAEKIEDKKPATKKIADKKVVAEKIEDKKPAAKKIADKKPETKKIEDKKPVAEKITDKKNEAKK